MLRTTLLAPKSVRNLSKNLVSAVTCVITRKSWRYTSGYSHTKSCLDTPLVGTRSEWPVTMPGFVTLKFQWRYFWRNFDWCKGVFTKLNGCFLLIFEICHNLPLKKVEFINRGNDLFFASHPSSEVSESVTASPTGFSPQPVISRRFCHRSPRSWPCLQSWVMFHQFHLFHPTQTRVSQEIPKTHTHRIHVRYGFITHIWLIFCNKYA